MSNFILKLILFHADTSIKGVCPDCSFSYMNGGLPHIKEAVYDIFPVLPYGSSTSTASASMIISLSFFVLNTLEIIHTSEMPS